MASNGGVDVTKVLADVWASELARKLAVFVFSAWPASATGPSQLGTPSSTTSTWGDTFGALSTSFSGLAFLGVAIGVALQLTELKKAREERRKNELAGQKSDRIIGRATEALRAAAQLDAAALLATECEQRVIPVWIEDSQFDVPEKRIYLQYIRIVLNSTTADQPHPRFPLPADASMFRRYLVSIASEALFKLESAPSIDAQTARALLADVKNEVWTLTAQRGLLESRDADMVRLAVRLLKPLVTRESSAQDESYAMNVRMALSLIGHQSMTS